MLELHVRDSSSLARFFCLCDCSKILEQDVLLRV